MEVVSTARTTILSSFPDFHTKFQYRQGLESNEKFDFQFFPKKKLFVVTNRKSDIEFLQISSNQQDETLSTISKLKKIKLENINCVGVPKVRNTKESNEIAVGFSNGQIKFLDYLTSEVNNIKFHSDPRNNSVIHLDYNNTDEYLSSVYESGIINLYGIKTKTKLETLKLDGNLTLARFHPTKRLQLSIASYKGSVFIYDLQCRRKIFQSLEDHSAPCRDLCISPSQPDLLLTAGYDSLLNIHDVRRKVQPIQVKCSHPLSCIAVSECGLYCCLGNLKGELISYDLRNLKTQIWARKIYEEAVTRVAFVPIENKDRHSLPVFTQQQEEENEISRKSILNNKTEASTRSRDSFADFLDFHTNLKDTLRPEKHSPKKRESFDWDSLNIKRTSRTEEILENDVFRDCVNENLDKNSSNEVTTLNDHQKLLAKNKLITNVATSTVIVAHKNRLTGIIEEESKNEGDVCKTKRISGSSESVFHRNINDFNIQTEILKEIKDMRSEFDEKLKHLEFEVNFRADAIKWQSYTSLFNFFKEQFEFNEGLCQAMECLLRTDSFFIEYEKLKEENKLLKLKLDENNQTF